MKFRLQSLNDVVTNSSMEVYQEATQYTVNAVRDIINVILKISGSDKSCDDLFTISINYEDMLDSYFDCDWRYPSTEVSIVPKGEASPADVTILNKINDLFNVEACYN